MIVDLAIIFLIVLTGFIFAGIYLIFKARGKEKTDDKYTSIYLSIGGLDRRIKELKKFVENLTLTVEKLSVDVDNIKNGRDIQPIVESLKKTMEAQVSFSKALQLFKEKILTLEKMFNENISQLKVSQRKVTSFKEEKQDSEIKIAKLTATEMKVLRVLATSGPKTASEIREIIGKTREHSGRLMKKLFLEGYVERDTTTMPYTYRISKKIKDSLELSSGS
ncbi:MAG: MarR family winged helix-turn-helix transcriptional regulator [Candidatus Bathyarchaeota archaeon]|nr:MarR family winged helix-turn-helix transcriptional regulator [Candidatus Bathyarchaeota archaeon]